MDKWSEYQKLVLHELESNSREIERLRTEFKDEFKLVREDIQTIQVQIAFLKVKSGVWGLIGGAIPVVVAIAAKVFLDA